MSDKRELNYFGAFAQMPIIDGHVHVWQGFQPHQIWDTLNTVGVQSCNALSLNNFDKGGTLNEQALNFKRVSNGRAYAFGSLDYTRHLQGGKMEPNDLVEQAQRIKEMGFDGIKMWEGKPLGYIVLPDRLDGRFFDPFFTWMEEQGFPITLHLADAPRFWDPARKGLDFWSYVGEPYPSRQEMYAEMEVILNSHPRLKIIMAHFLFLWGELQEARRILDAHPSIAFDLTPGVQGYVQLSQDVVGARQFFLDYQDRLIYGTDIGTLLLFDPAVEFDVSREAGQPWLVRTFLETDWDIPFPGQIGVTKFEFYKDRLCGIALPAPALEKIYSLNFQRMVGNTPVKL
jgi:predicted TIM-barrel fold metal-dependent hydrolase